MTASTAHISEPIQSVIPDPGSENAHNVLQPQRPLDPHSSVEDYKRIMRDYTQRRMSTFTDKDDLNSVRGSSTSSRASRGSHSSNGSPSSDAPSSATSTPTITSGLMAGQQQ